MQITSNGAFQSYNHPTMTRYGRFVGSIAVPNQLSVVPYAQSKSGTVPISLFVYLSRDLVARVWIALRAIGLNTMPSANTSSSIFTNVLGICSITHSRPRGFIDRGWYISRRFSMVLSIYQ